MEKDQVVVELALPILKPDRLEDFELILSNVRSCTRDSFENIKYDEFLIKFAEIYNVKVYTSLIRQYVVRELSWYPDMVWEEIKGKIKIF